MNEGQAGIEAARQARTWYFSITRQQRPESGCVGVLPNRTCEAAAGTRTEKVSGVDPAHDAPRSPPQQVKRSESSALACVTPLSMGP